MKTTLFFLATLTIIILFSCTEELDFKIHEFKKRGLHAKDFALISADTCYCQIKFDRLYQCNDCSHESLHWYLSTGGAFPYFFNYNTIVFGQWYPIRFRKNYNYDFILNGVYPPYRYGEFALDFYIQCNQTYLNRIKSYEGSINCIDSVGSPGHLLVKLDSSCNFIYPTSGLTFPLVDPCRPDIYGTGY